MKRLWVLLLLLGLWGCKPAGGDETAEAEARLVARGVEVYRAQGCGVCHTLARAGTRGVFGPSHDGVGTTAEDRIHEAKYRGKATTALEYLRESVLDPGAYHVSGYEFTRFRMPAYTEIPDSDLDALVALLASEQAPGAGAAKD